MSGVPSLRSARPDMKVVIAGGTGTLGRRIAGYLASAGHEVAVLTRSPRDGFPYRQIAWDGRTVGRWANELEGAIVINLAGELVDRRPTKRNIELLRTSRVEPTRALVEASAPTRLPFGSKGVPPPSMETRERT